MENWKFWEHKFNDAEVYAWEELLQGYGILIAVALFGLELIRYAWLRKLGWRLVGDAAASIVTQVLFLLTAFASFGIYLSVFYAIYPRFTLVQLPTNGWTIALVILLADFMYYWEHRVAHRTGIGWATHTVHHSSAEYNISVAYRHGPLDPIFGLPFVLPLVFLGFSPVLVLFAVGMVQLYQFWLHTEAIGRLPRIFEFVFNTPSHHRVHHGSNAEYLDRNYAGILILWDRLFGTFREERAPVLYGVLPPLQTLNPLRVWLHGFVRLYQKMRGAGTIARGLLAILLPPDQPLSPVRAEGHSVAEATRERGG